MHLYAFVYRPVVQLMEKLERRWYLQELAKWAHLRGHSIEELELRALNDQDEEIGQWTPGTKPQPELVS